MLNKRQTKEELDKDESFHAEKLKEIHELKEKQMNYPYLLKVMIAKEYKFGLMVLMMRKYIVPLMELLWQFRM